MIALRLTRLPWRRLESPSSPELARSEKQKIPLDTQAPRDQQVLQRKSTQTPDGKRGIEDEELHRQSGHRVGDQGAHKRK